MSSDEPNYIFIRGTGWVVSDALEYLEYTKGGRTIGLERRAPRKGERYFKMEIRERLSDVFSDIKHWAFEDTYFIPRNFGVVCSAELKPPPEECAVVVKAVDNDDVLV